MIRRLVGILVLPLVAYSSAPSEPEAQLAGVPSDHYYEDAISRFAPLGLIDAPAVERLRALARHFPPPRLRKQIQLLLERRIGAADASVDLSVMVPADRDDGTDATSARAWRRVAAAAARAAGAGSDGAAVWAHVAAFCAQAEGRFWWLEFDLAADACDAAADVAGALASLPAVFLISDDPVAELEAYVAAARAGEAAAAAAASAATDALGGGGFDVHFLVKDQLARAVARVVAAGGSVITHGFFHARGAASPSGGAPLAAVRLEAEFGADDALEDRVRAVLARDDDDDGGGGGAPLSGDGAAAPVASFARCAALAGTNAIVSLDVTPSGAGRVFGLTLHVQNESSVPAAAQCLGDAGLLGARDTVDAFVDELHVLRAWSDDSICANFGHLKVQFDRRSGALAAAKVYYRLVGKPAPDDPLANPRKPRKNASASKTEGRAEPRPPPNEQVSEPGP